VVEVVVVVEEANFFSTPSIFILKYNFLLKKAHSKTIYHTIICNYTKLHKWFCGTFLIF
jgi:hypothetical protein